MSGFALTKLVTLISYNNKKKQNKTTQNNESTKSTKIFFGPLDPNLNDLAQPLFHK